MRLIMEKHKIFKAFSNEVRLKVFEFLLEGKMCVSGIVNKLNVTQPTVTQHLKILQEVGVVKSEKIGYWMHYSIDKGGIERVRNELKQFIENLQTKNGKCKISTQKCPEKK